MELARRLAPGFRVDADGDLLEPRSTGRAHAGSASGGLGVSLVVAFIAGVARLRRSGRRFLLYFKQAPFGEKDPIFGHDISLLRVLAADVAGACRASSSARWSSSLVLAAIMHLVMGGIDYQADGRGARRRGGAPARPGPASPFARAQRAAAPQIPQIDLKLGGRAVAHLSALLAAIFVVVGVGQLFQGWNLLYSTAGRDLRRRLHGRPHPPAAHLRDAWSIAFAARRRARLEHPAAAPVVAGSPSSSGSSPLIVLRGIVPAVYQSLIVNPNQLTKERQYIANNLGRHQAGLRAQRHHADSRSRPRRRSRRRSSSDNQPTLRNIRLWDPNTLVTSYRQLQELRPYYSFLDADVDRYTVNGVYRQTMLSPRELNIDGLPAQAQTWVNQHITYTHGFGVAMSAVNQVTARRLARLPRAGRPAAERRAGLEITQPRIYYGERGTDYSLVKTKDQEFDYPGAGGDVYTTLHRQRRHPHLAAPQPARLLGAVRHHQVLHHVGASRAESRIIIRNDIRDAHQRGGAVPRRSTPTPTW